MLNLIRTNSLNADFRKLVTLLDKELWSRYEEEQATYDQYNKLHNINTVVLAYYNEQPIGCGCLKQFDDDTMEVKRMFVLPEHRGQGIAHAILRELEAWACEQSYCVVILETGVRQPEAIQLYKKSGYRVIDNYGQYVGMKSSVCMSK
jgi:GNAT superfamily N-acetyltransferase